MEHTFKDNDDNYMCQDVFGNLMRMEVLEDTKGMISPVRCSHCGTIYDLCSVTPIARYADCTTFESPCCKKHVDDREWKGMPDIKRLNK